MKRQEQKKLWKKDKADGISDLFVERQKLRAFLRERTDNDYYRSFM